MAEVTDGDAKRPLVNFQNVISLGSVLIIVSMLASASGVLIVVGRQMQGMVDQINEAHSDLVHETEMRVIGEKAESDARVATEKALVNQIGAMTVQETRDVQQINATLQGMRDDYRDLLRASAQVQHR